MRRRWATAGALLAGAGAFFALAWMSAQLLRLEQAEAGARLTAAREQAANLALWRMDLSLARLVAEEGMRAAIVTRQGIFGTWRIRREDGRRRPPETGRTGNSLRM